MAASTAATRVPFASHRPAFRCGSTTTVVAVMAAMAASAVIVTTRPTVASAQAVAADGVFTIADGGYSFEAPRGWKRVQPKSRIVDTEFQIPGAESAEPGRMTVMGAGGSVAQNIERWYGQFAQPDGSNTKDHATTKQLKIAGCGVTIVDITGTYKDMPGGPFAGGQMVQRPDYRMLAAIVETDGGNYFLKFYGPKATVGANADGFVKMVEGLVAANR